MPNWIEGTMKVRGTPQSVMNFMENAFDAEVSKDMCESYCEYSLPDWAWIKNSHRAFTWGDFCGSLDADENIVIISVPIRQAWSFTSRDESKNLWINLAKKYNVDIRLQGFECGFEFYQDVVVSNGEMIINNVIQYENWNWECPMPNLGG